MERVIFGYIGGGVDEPPMRARILLVEDDAQVRAMIAKALERYGYGVTAVGIAREALRVFETANPRFDLLITDIVLPGRSGLDLHRALSKHRPGLPVVFMSGYSEEILARQGEQPTGSIFLGKPFTPSALRTAVGLALSAAERRSRGNGGGAAGG